MNNVLLKNLEVIKNKIHKKDQDYVCVVDGNEGSGKSVFAMQIAKWIDPTLCIERVCMNGEEFKEAINKAKQHEAIIFDEAFTGLSSRSSLSAINKVLVSKVMQMRQKNLFVVVVLPSIFMVDRYISMHRARLLFHIWEKNNIHYWKCFNKKRIKKLILFGSKTYSYHSVAKTILKNKGKFFNIYAVDEEKYRTKKLNALEETSEEIEEESKYIVQRNFLLHIICDHYNKKQVEIAKQCKEHKIPLTATAINKILSKFKEKPQYFEK